LLFVSDESGRPEVYLAQFPRGEDRWQVSADGGLRASGPTLLLEVEEERRDSVADVILVENWLAEFAKK